MNNVLSRPAGNLQHNAPLGQNARKNIEYRALVALGRGDEPFPVGLLLATLPKHQGSVKANVPVRSGGLVLAAENQTDSLENRTSFDRGNLHVGARVIQIPRKQHLQGCVHETLDQGPYQVICDALDKDGDPPSSSADLLLHLLCPNIRTPILAIVRCCDVFNIGSLNVSESFVNCFLQVEKSLSLKRPRSFNLLVARLFPLKPV
jgi:hypothetical protein